MVEIVHGYDYGTKPKVMVVADIEFPEILRNSFMALGYGQVPQFGDLANVPLLMMLFKDLDGGMVGINAFHISMLGAMLLETGTQLVLDSLSSTTGDMGCVSTRIMNSLSSGVSRRFIFQRLNRLS
jgi:hypothetical protein